MSPVAGLPPRAAARRASQGRPTGLLRLRGRLRRAVLAWGLALAAAPASADTAVAPAAEPAPPPAIACAGLPAIQVQAERADDALLFCDGASRAWHFLAAVPLRLPPVLRVRIVDELPGDLRGTAMGCYFRDTRHIELLSLRAFTAHGTWFRQPTSAELYRSAAAHETAHAIVGCHVDAAPLPVPAHEYVAYVAMFATMDPATRARILAALPGHGFGSTLEINTIVYISDPLLFAANAWRHFQTRRQPRAWLRDVVEGGVVPEFPTEGP